jgi:hypothetical protein
LRKLDNWLEAYLEYNDNTEPPKIYHKWIAVSCVAAVLRRKCFLSWGSLLFYPNFYIVLVGPPGRCRKGTAMGPGFRLLSDLNIKMAAESITREALIRELKDSSDSQVDLTTGKMCLHASLTIYSPELTVFLGYNNHQLMSDLTDWFDCRERWTYRTKNMGTDDIVGVWVNLIGATTPDLIQTALPLDAIGSGLTSRIIFVYADKKDKVCPAPFLTQEQMRLWTYLVQDLEQMSMVSGAFRVTSAFMERWTDWYIRADSKPPFTDPRLAPYVERRPTHLFKLSMIMAMFRDKTMSRIIEEVDLLSAIDLLEETEGPMLSTFGGVGKNAQAPLLNRIMVMISDRKSITRQDLLQMYLHDTSSEELDGILKTLDDAGYIKIRFDGSNCPTIEHVPGSNAKSLGVKYDQSALRGN